MIGAVFLLADGADQWAFYIIVLSGTLLVAYQTCPADQDTFLFSRGAAISKQITDVFLNCVLFAQFLVFCLAFHRLMVCNIF